MVDFPEVTAQPQSMSSTARGLEVEVEVNGPKHTPDTTRRVRAAAKALLASGVLPTAINTVEDVTMGQINMMTEQKGEPHRVSSGRFTEKTHHTILVNRD